MIENSTFTLICGCCLLLCSTSIIAEVTIKPTFIKYCLTLLLLSAFALNSQAQPGTIDKSFGTDKIGIIKVPSQSVIRTSAKQSDDKLLLGGYGPVAGQYSLIRHEKDGSIDSTFRQWGANHYKYR